MAGDRLETIGCKFYDKALRKGWLVAIGKTTKIDDLQLIVYLVWEVMGGL